MKTTHKNIEITYNEDTNKWEFELRGMNRKADSLTRAKEVIDQPVKKKSTFERQKAWMDRWGDGWETVDVTSCVPPRWGGDRVECWIIRGKERQKLTADHLFTLSPKNNQIIDQIRDLQKKRVELEEKIRKLTDTLEPIKVPEFEATES